ncbi:DNA glycosylase AlkZ-like family protein [Hoyosella altamirensis]|uniref:Winged helix DNA-binding domain-containing protein n=1 Tax=Hoyosella altamirensis TaxID=616997 RepID=A0A839RR42_9ACTN|nr:crosslink repair DNA glycosylase YcaQ family protein [Hoyosella altamirensis]MBB3039295.1 hypothetical protein [Hoyosella altamirensis]
MTADAITRAQALAYRAHIHDLNARGTGRAALRTGLQDYPPGRSAGLAFELRAGRAPGSDIVLVHSVRGALHLHDMADFQLYASALRTTEARDLARQSIGPFASELSEAGIGFPAALDEVASAMRNVIADVSRPTKGELSSRVSPLVNGHLTPWCSGCGAAHVHDHLFRMATLQAGLVVELAPELPSQFRYAAAKEFDRIEPQVARSELVRRFLTTAGPAHPKHLATWLAMAPAAARKWWDLVVHELEPVHVDGKARWALAGQSDAAREAPAPRGVRLLPPYDPFLELADRDLLVPDPAQRRQVWRAAANPGVVLVDGAIAGTWRQRHQRKRLTVRVSAFGRLPERWLELAEPDAAVIGRFFAASGVDIELTTARS